MVAFNPWDSSYKFNAKELDGETGLYYYGARFYDARTSVWYGVDKKAEDSFSWSPYTYCINNPMIYVDPDGMIWKPWQKNNSSFRNTEEKKMWTTAHNNLYGSNSIYKKVYDQLDKSAFTYDIKQPYIDGGWLTKGQYNKDKRTIEPFMNVEEKMAPMTMFEEVFHAGQDDYHNKKGTSQTGLEIEVEAKFMEMAQGIGKDEFNISKNCPNILKAIKEGREIDYKLLIKDQKGLQSVATSVNSLYQFSGKEAILNSNTLFEYTNSLIEDK